MTDTTASVPPPEGDIPEAAIERRRYRSSQLIWLVPIIAAIVGLSLAVKFYLEQGPVITITFKSGEGIEAGKTRIKFKDVQVGLVKSITISRDRSSVKVVAQLNKEAENLLVADTRFWVVSPRISGGGISGLNTLMGGSYIAMDAGVSTAEQVEFTGLDGPPAVKMDEPGRQFVLQAQDIGSLNVASPIYYRRIQAGEVISYQLNKEGSGVTITIFIRAPFDQYVKANTLFWHASGVEFSLDAGGVKVNTQSVSSILLGGIAFQTPEDNRENKPAPSNSIFTLFADRDEALKRSDTIVERYLLVFHESVRGLSVGAPVDLRGVAVGEVSKIGVELGAGRKNVVMPVEINFYPERLRARYRTTTQQRAPTDTRKLLATLVEQGLRAQLRNGNLLTGQLYIALDFFPKETATRIDWTRNPPLLPTTTGSLEQFQTSLMQVVQKLERLPLEELAGDARTTLKRLDSTLASADHLLKGVDASLLPEARGMVHDVRTTLDELRTTLTSARQALAADAPLQHDLREALREMNRAAQSLRTLGDYLERHPEALLQGKKEETR
ncbi:PqiB family protein [Trichlorobacter ammonificans]|uniref:Paraquat-inducible protein B n=1 Tax=Trichlorobacter ammonificans TaxID=2916410 RepID=A0ABM9DA48_9BACT|nr:MlaD family protein [Trichlorobacter ammonificans]CAH2032073.1 Paraquat-inducible protein B [Trichlorobacter ammonificans]